MRFTVYRTGAAGTAPAGPAGGNKRHLQAF
jgi:hypothetical protein